MLDKKSFQKIINNLAKKKSIQDVVNIIHNKGQSSLKMLNGSLKAFVVSEISKQLSSPLIILTETKQSQENWLTDLSLILNDTTIALINNDKSSKVIGDSKISSQIDNLSRTLENSNSVIIAQPEVFELSLPAPEAVIDDYIELMPGQEIEFEELVKKLALGGFERVDYVAGQGDMAVRGGIIDVFPVGWDNPLRIEFWGDEIDSIREFNSISQRSIINHESVKLLCNVYNSHTEDYEGSVFDYFDDSSLIVMDSPESLNIEAEILSKISEYKFLLLNPLGKTDITIKSEPQPGFHGSVKDLTDFLIEYYQQQADIFLTADGNIHLDRLQDIISNHLAGRVEDGDISVDLREKLLESILWADNTAVEGFILHPESVNDKTIINLTEHQIFDRAKSRNSRPKRKGMSLIELNELKRGDYIVHESKGIGQFDGFEQVSMGGTAQDCARIIYSGGDLLYVNLNYIHKLQKYKAQDGVQPKLTKLGSSEWARKKARTKKKLKDIARDLIKLYAKRKSTVGFTYPQDNVWQKEFEASFIYEDTPDQVQSTDEVKKDMQSESPMDRLVCGDVGFGKTEIALRAAFKAVQSGRQVAVLVPTTILAQQHYMTFKDRFHKYPIFIEALSRFKTKKQQTEILEALKSGRCDIIIGTHRILSKDIGFKDLGLLIIDEEHRFGVSAKEKLRKMKVNVDTLTLTATPIPRTLNFSLMGARDLSIIETPPRNRIPVVTELIEWDQEIIVEAIEKEIKRGGQVFFVNDKVEDIEKITSNLKMLLPHYRFGIAHGQMKSKELEKVMEKFMQKKFDVLVTTKIIESGLDIPSANTMLINRSQNFGLAELYQLRGRVGRTNIQAYCYLIIPPAYKLPTRAIRRLQAIEEFTDLGSGLKLSMRDLEIRGAGNLLGAEQSGFIIDIGFDMFHKILDEAVTELRYEEFNDIFPESREEIRSAFENDEIVIEIGEEALFPPDYISNDTDRFYFYNKLLKTRNYKELEEITNEIKDRYGKLPPQADNLIYTVKLRMNAIFTGFTRISLGKGKFTAEFPPQNNEKYYQEAFPHVVEYIQTIDNAELKQTPKKLFLKLPINNKDEAAEIIWKIKKTIDEII